MNKITDWIKSHQVAAFFVITFAITWGLGFSYDAVLNKGILGLAPLFFTATCGPALAGIIISMICNNQPKKGTNKATWIAFLVAWILSASVFIANNTILLHVPLNFPLAGFTLVSVVPVAFVISMTCSRIPAVRSYLSSLTHLRGVWRWSLLALALFPAMLLLSFSVSSVLGHHYIITNHLPNPNLIGLIAVKFIYQLFFFNATGEEVGWRGFALPKLQVRTSPLVASLTLASVRKRYV